MDTAEVDRIIALATNPTLIAGIYNYCDRCCHRCPFTERCLSYLESREGLAQADADPTASVATIVKGSLRRAIDMMRVIAERHGIEIATPPQEEEQLVEQEARTRAEARADALVADA